MRAAKRSCHLPRHNGFAIRDVVTYFRCAFTKPNKISRRQITKLQYYVMVGKVADALDH